MKVVHVPYCFYPDPVGGTEVYVEALARHLQAQGVDIVVAAPASEDNTYAHNGIPVRRYGISQAVNDLSELYGEGDQQASRRFGAILDKEQPDLVHLHAFTSGASLLTVREAKRRAIPVIFTYHTPTVSCQRGTLMRWETEICDGVLDVDVCTRCTLHGLGMSQPIADVIGRTPVGVGKTIGVARLSGRPWTALRMRSLIQQRHQATRALFQEVDHIVAVCNWIRDVLEHNGVPKEKITVSRHGLSEIDALPDGQCETPSPPPLRVAFLGRLHPTKGVHVLIKAIVGAPQLEAELDVYGIPQGEDGVTYGKQLRELAADDPRIAFKSPIRSDEVGRCLQRYHALVVPSQVLETGPFVVLEAFATGIPVIGSNLGGIAELVEHGVDGLLVQHNSLNAWIQALTRLTEDKSLNVRLKQGVRPPRKMKKVALEMAKLYRDALDTQNRTRK